MKISRLGKVLIATGGIALTTLGSCEGRKAYRAEAADTYIRAMDKGNVEMGRNFRSFEFTQSLLENSAKIKNIADIDEDTFIIFRDLSVGMAKEESNFGLNNDYARKANMPKLAEFFKKLKGDRGLSKGLTNFKIDEVKNPKELALIKKLGVTDVFEPKDSALATMVHLKFLSEDYKNKYLLEIAPFQEKPLTLPEYLLVRWKGLRINTISKDANIKALSEKNMAAIVADRTADIPKTYVWRILRSIGYAWDANSNKVIKAALRR